MIKTQNKILKQIHDIYPAISKSCAKIKLDLPLSIKKTAQLDCVYNDEKIIKKLAYVIEPGSKCMSYDKLFFLLGLKPVLRMETDTNYNTRISQKELLAGLDDLEYEEYNNYTFVSFYPVLAKLAKNLTIKSRETEMINRETSDEMNYIFGKLYGYPDCCSKNFPNINSLNESSEYELWKQTEFEHRGYKLMLHYYPCSNECLKTRDIKNYIKLKMDELGI